MNKQMLREPGKVSVILPTYNRPEWIGGAIMNILQQTYTNWELIIVDDGSTYETKAAVLPFLSDKRIKYVFVSKNSSNVSIPRNIGIVRTTGTYMVHADDDCPISSDKLETLVAALEKVNTNGIKSYFAYGDRTCNGERFSNPHYNPNENWGVDTSQFMYLASVYDHIPLVFSRRACDWNLAKAIWNHCPQFTYVPKVVSNYIWHGKNRSLDETTKDTIIYPNDYKEFFIPGLSRGYTFDLKSV